MKNEISYEQLNHELNNNLDSILDKNKQKLVLLDVRTPEEYSGDYIKSGASYGGHIKGAILFPHYELMNEDGNFKDTKELQNILISKNINPEDNIIIYCHSGQRSEIATYILSNIVKYPKVRNYVGSWIEWSNKNQK